MLSIVIACQNKNKQDVPKFKSIKYLQGKILNDSLILGTGTDIFLSEEKLYVSTTPADKYVKIYDSDSGKAIGEIIDKGRGPNEVMYVSSMIIHNDSIIISDRGLCRYSKFPLSFINNGSQSCDLLNFPISDIIAKNDNRFLIGNVHCEDNVIRYAWIDNTGKILYSFNEYPNIKISQDKKGIEYLYGLEGKHATNPNNTKMISVCSLGETIEIFDIQDSQIVKIKEVTYRKPIAEVRNRHVMPIMGSTIFGFMDVYATNNKIYTIYCGDTEGRTLNKIAVFDWEGTPETLYTVDSDILYRICVNSEETKIYAIGLNKNRETVIFSFDI